MQNSTEGLYSSRFNYEVVLDILSGGQYRLVNYNSPYKNSEQELDDIHTFLTVDGYRILTLTDHSPGRYRLHVICTYLPNPAEVGTYDQVFSLVKMDRIDGNSEN